MSRDVAEEYASSLADLTVNSKPLINMLTMLAEDYIDHAPIIVKAVEAHLQKVPGDIKLPVLYLIDSIVKNVGKDYISLFTQNIVSTFCFVFEKVDEKVRAQMFKLRQTWNDVFPSKKLYALDARVNAIDPAWPITATPPTSIHVNPKFLQGTSSSSPVSSPDPVSPSNINDGVMREQLLKKQKELLELQKRKKSTQPQYKVDGQYQRQQDRAFVPHIPGQVDGASVNVTSQETGGFRTQHSGLNQKGGSGILKTDCYTTKPSAISNTINVSARSRDPRIRLKERLNEKKNKTPDITVSVEDTPAVKSSVVMVGVNSAHTTKSKRENKKKKLLVKKKDKGNDKVQKSIPSLNNEKQNKEHNVVSSDKSQRAVSKKESKTDKPDRKLLSVYKVKAGSKISKVNSVISPESMNCDKTLNPKFSIDKTLYDKARKEETPDGSHKDLHNTLEKHLKKDEYSDQDHKVNKKSPTLPDGSRAVNSMNNGTSKPEKRKLLNVENISKRLCVTESSKSLCDSSDGETKVQLPFLKSKPTFRIKFPKYVRESTDSPLSSSSTSSSSPIPASITHSSSSSIPSLISSSDDTSGKDVDLRLLPSPTKRRLAEQDQAPLKKSKAEIIDTLFGNEDVDLRTLPPQPPTPPPPIISSDSPDTPDSEKSWANYKQIKTESKSPEGKKRKSKIDKLGRPLLYNQIKGEGSDDEKSSRPSDSDRSSSNCNLIIKQAEEQLSSGNITFSQYNRMLKEVITMNEERKLQEAQRKDEMEGALESTSECTSSDSSPRDPLDSTLESTSESTIENSAETVILDTTDDTLDCKSDSTPESTSPDVSTKAETPIEPEPVKEQKIIRDIEEVLGLCPEKEKDKDENVGSGFEEETQTESNQAPSSSISIPAASSDAEPRVFVDQIVENKPRPFQEEILRNQECERKNFQVPGSYEPTKVSHPPRPWLMVPPPVQPPPPPLIVHEMAPFPRWPHPVPPRPVFEHDNPQFSGYPPANNHPVPVKNNFPVLPRDVPPADPVVLELIEKDTMHTINIDCIPREVRFYGEVAIIMLSWDDPREITFQPGSRMVIIDDREPLMLNFNSPYREIVLDGQRTRIRLGAPTRELFIDGKFYEAKFAGPPIKVMVGGRMHTVKLEGPLPQVRIGNIKRTDLVAGKINLIVDAKHMFPLFLDAKPQRFEIDGIAYILRFVEALQTIVINGRPFKIEFGGLPVPIYFRGVKHFLRLSVLPHGIKPGYISIVNMEGGRLPSPPPVAQLPVIPPNVPPPLTEIQPAGSREILNEPPPKVVSAPDTLNHPQNLTPSGNEHPLELLTSLMPTALAPSSGQSYTVEQASDDQQRSSSSPDINVGELFQKLVAIGIVPPVKEKEQPPEDSNTIRVIDFSQPDTLKLRQPSIIKKLYSGIQCSSCGVRFSPEQTVKYSQHLDWHFRQNRRDRDSARIAQSRKWYYDISDWIQYQEIEDLEERAQSWFEMQEGKLPVESEDLNDEDPSVVAGANNENVACIICQDKFEQFYNEEKEEWHLRRAIRIDDKVYHPLCYQDFKESQVRRVIEPTKSEGTVTISSDSQPDDLEIIELDDPPLDDELSPTKKYISSAYPPPDSGIATENMSSSEIEIISDVGEDSKLDDTLPSSESGLTLESESLSDQGVASTNCEFGSESEDNNEDYDEADYDDDILHVEVLEQKIESYEIPDDDDDDDDNIASESSSIKFIDSINRDQTDDEDFLVDMSRVRIKQEKSDIDLPEPVVDTTHTSLTTSIDGNVEFEEAPQIVIPGKIKINISKALLNKVNREVKSSSTPPKDDFKMPSPPPTDQATVLALVEQMQPPPPGEELCPAHIKPRIVGTKMTEYPAVMKGSELSGLCSIM